MVLLASSPPCSSLRFQLIPFASRSWPQVHGRLLSHSCIRISPTCSMKTSTAPFGEPDKLKEQVIIIRDKVQEAIPKSVKDFPWEKAENLLLEKLIFLGKKVLNWGFLAWFIISSLSDAVVSVATNQELMIPMGLLIGCLMCDFLKETSQEMHPSPEGKGLNWQIVGISCFFVLVKVLSVFFGLKARMFLLHVGNGGILQVLWLFWGISWREDGEVQKNLSPGQDAFITEVAIKSE